MKLSEEVELAKARETVRFAKLCLQYQRGEGHFSYRKKGVWALLFSGPTAHSRAFHSLMYSPELIPPPHMIEEAEAIIKKYECAHPETPKHD